MLPDDNFCKQFVPRSDTTILICILTVWHRWYSWENFSKKLILKNISRRQKAWEITQGGKELNFKLQVKSASENVVWWSRLLQIIAKHYWRISYRSKQRGPRTDCSNRSSLIWVHTVCHRCFLNISADEKSRQLLLRLEH